MKHLILVLTLAVSSISSVCFGNFVDVTINGISTGIFYEGITIIAPEGIGFIAEFEGGETCHLKISYTDLTSAKIEYNGEITSLLGAGEFYELVGGDILHIVEVLYTSKDSAFSKVEFNLGRNIGLDDEFEFSPYIIKGVSIPEPLTICLLAFGGLIARKKA